MQEIETKVNKIAIYIDFINQELHEIKEYNVKHNLKNWLNKSLITTNRFIKECDSILNKENQISFGDESDELRIIIDKYLGIIK